MSRRLATSHRSFGDAPPRLARLLALALTLEGATACRAPTRVEEGLASYYGGVFHQRQTASGDTFDEEALTAAHRKLAFGTRVRVVRPDTGHSVWVRINDRGPFVEGRLIDLSKGAARRLHMLDEGTVTVRLEIYE